MERNYYVYMLANWNNRVLYVGVTNDLVRRIGEHRSRSVKGFTAKYNVTKLVYFDSVNDVTSAIQREKALKGWRRDRKVALVEQGNEEWRDLWYDIIA